MKNLKILFSLIFILLSACSSQTIKYNNLVPDLKPGQITKNNVVKYTENEVTLKTDQHSSIAIVASKEGNIVSYKPQHEIIKNRWKLNFYKVKTYKRSHKLKQNYWNIDAYNLSDKPQCVGLQWKLMDFEFINDQPLIFYVPGHSIVRIGTMVQKVWEFDNVKFVPYSSGFVQSMYVKEPIEDALPENECSFPE